MRFMRKTKRRAVPPLFFSAYEIELKGIRYVFYAVFAHIAQGIFQKRFTGNTCVFPEPKNKRRKTVVFRLFL